MFAVCFQQLLAVEFPVPLALLCFLWPKHSSPPCSLGSSCPACPTQTAAVCHALQKRNSTLRGVVDAGTHPGHSVQQDKPVVDGWTGRWEHVHQQPMACCGSCRRARICETPQLGSLCREAVRALRGLAGKGRTGFRAGSERALPAG